MIKFQNNRIDKARHKKALISAFLFSQLLVVSPIVLMLLVTEKNRVVFYGVLLAIFLHMIHLLPYFLTLRVTQMKQWLGYVTRSAILKFIAFSAFFSIILNSIPAEQFKILSIEFSMVFLISYTLPFFIHAWVGAQRRV